MTSLRNKIILVTGASGSIGSALSKTLATMKPKLLIILDQDETGIFDLYEEIKNKCFVEYVIGNIRDREAMDYLFSHFKPDLIFHCAAYKHIVLMEKWKSEAYKTNILGLSNMVELAIQYGTKKFIFISSDKSVNPSSVMGQTKARGEEICLKSNGTTKFVVVRFGNVMPSRGSVVPIFQKQISENKDLTVTGKKMRRYFMGIYDAVNLVIRASQIGKGGEIFLLDMGEQIYIQKLAELMIKLSGKPLKVVFTRKKKGEKFHEELYDKKTEKIKKVEKGILLVTKNELPRRNILEKSSVKRFQKRLARSL